MAFCWCKHSVVLTQIGWSFLSTGFWADPGLDDTHQKHPLSDTRLSRQGHVSHESEVVLSSNSRKSETQRVQNQLITLLHCFSQNLLSQQQKPAVTCSTGFSKTIPKLICFLCVHFGSIFIPCHILLAYVIYASLCPMTSCSRPKMQLLDVDLNWNVTKTHCSMGKTPSFMCVMQ